jgi:hypothetical protein
MDVGEDCSEGREDSPPCREASVAREGQLRILYTVGITYICSMRVLEKPSHPQTRFELSSPYFLRAGGGFFHRVRKSAGTSERRMRSPGRRLGSIEQGRRLLPRHGIHGRQGVMPSSRPGWSHPALVRHAPCGNAVLHSQFCGFISHAWGP